MAKLDADGGNNRNQGIFKGMEDNDFQFRLALGLSSCNVVLPDDLKDEVFLIIGERRNGER